MKYWQIAVCLWLCSTWAGVARAQEQRFRLYDSVTVFVSNNDGKPFTVAIDLRDINHLSRCPAELLVKIYDPEGRVLVRQVVPDDGIVNPTFAPYTAGWDHEAWYYATLYSRGLMPAVSFSVWTDPDRLAQLPARPLRFEVPAGPPGVYRVMLAGSPDHVIDLSTEPALPWGISGGPDWVHGHHDLHARRHFYVPRDTTSVSLRLLENDRPATRTATITDQAGRVLLTVDGAAGLAEARYDCQQPGELDEQVLTVSVTGDAQTAHDYLLEVSMTQPQVERHRRGEPRVPAVLCTDADAARTLRNGAIYHDGKVFWQPYQVALYDWVNRLSPQERRLPADLPQRPDYISPGSHEEPRSGHADVIMHHYPAHKDPRALNAAVADMLQGMWLIGPNDYVMHGRNMAYEMGTYSYFYHRPAWRILQQTDAPQDVKEPIRQFIEQIGDRLAFARGIELINGNALASQVQAMRYCVEATGDPLSAQLFDTFWERFTTGGFGQRVGVGPSGGIQENFGYDYHYGSYVLRGWDAVLADLNDPRFAAVEAGVQELYSYIWNPESSAAPFSSRTAHQPPSRTYDEERFPWQGNLPGDLTMSVRDANEFFVARRQNYYVVTYHGRICPAWISEGFHGQVGYGGGAITQLHIPGKGTVLDSRLSGPYGKGMHPSQWESFHLHSLVGQTWDGRPLVTANSEPTARLDGTLLTSTGQVRNSSVGFTRTYAFETDHIVCTIELSPSVSDNLFAIYSGRSVLRDHVERAYEMIPFIPFKHRRTTSRNPEDRTDVLAIGPDDEVLVLSEEPIKAKALVIDRGGYGVRIDLDQVRMMKRGKADTVMIELTYLPTLAGELKLSYVLRPFVGEAPLPAAANP